ncbi:hypothetical protein DAF96_18600 [Clostridioides difficile]|nr:hypothetical protein [Clostridioides difficile]
MKKIYLTNNNCDEACIELLHKLEKLNLKEEGQAIEIIAPTNPFTSVNVKLKAKIAKKLLELRIKFVVRIDCDDK